MARPALTNRQSEVLAEIKRLARECRRMPTVRELGAALGLTSTCTTQRHLEALQRKGRIRLPRHARARGIEFVGLSHCPFCGRGGEA